jgi:transcriptional regulator with XRE-family HTH domain
MRSIASLSEWPYGAFASSTEQRSTDWNMSNKKLSLPVNGSALLTNRQSRGWSQEELSRRSGYSVRVIRKAEAGGTLKIETLQTLCEALSITGGQVTLKDLTCDTLSIAKQVVESYDVYGVEMLKHCGHLMTNDIVYDIHADPARVPYAGAWHGLDGFQKCLDIFYSMFTRRPGSLKPSYLVGDQRVHARFLDQGYFNGEEIPPIVINLHFQFQGFLVCRLDNEFDSDLTVNSLEVIKENSNLPNHPA